MSFFLANQSSNSLFTHHVLEAEDFPRDSKYRKHVPLPNVFWLLATNLFKYVQLLYTPLKTIKYFTCGEQFI